MNKRTSLIAAVIGSIFAAAGGVAQAQTSVSVYGTIDAYAGSRQLSGGTRNTVVNDGGLSTSHFGFRGTEDLGGGLKANFDIAGFFGSDTGNSGRFAGDTLFSRRAAVGLSGGFGQVDMGRGSTPYFISMILFNPFVDSSGYSPIFLHTYTGGQFPISSPPINASDSGMSNMIQYTTPVFNGLRGALQYGMGEIAGGSGKNRISGSVNYFKGPLALSFAFERNKVGGIGTLTALTAGSQTSVMLGATYNFGAAKLFGQYKQTKQEFGAGSADDRTYKTFQLGTSVPLGPTGKVLVSWAHTRIDLPTTGVSPYTVIPGFPALPAGVATSGVDPTRNTVTIGYDHSLSKRTDIYVLGMTDKYTGLAKGTSFGAGIRHRF